MALLYVVDDGRSPLEGECFRLRLDATVIGRDEGDVVIPHDGLMSGRHAEIVRQSTPNGWRWLLRDLGSKNGTFVRISASFLKPGNEFLVGSGRYRFEAGSPLPAGSAMPSSQGTQGWDGPSVGALLPALVEVGPNGPGQRYPLRGEVWIGRDSRCGIVRAADELVSPRHACVMRDSRGEWQVRSNGAINGLWLRIADLPLGASCHFRLGEQKFLYRGTER
jgi:pSer/pThr/pTyr-binding forkhead associated (FHA) protein